MLLGTALSLIADYLHYMKGIAVVTWREIKQPALPETDKIFCWRETGRSSDYYSDLHIARNASPIEIRAAYRKLALKYHPDLNRISRTESAEMRMRQLNLAYQVLSSPDRRKAYDRSIA
jgi:preprotein translocase subunit Sec63